MLIGRAELVGMLVRCVPERVYDAITRYVALEPLNAIQTAEFVVHRLGEETSPVTCGDDAFRRIVAHSHGVPGTIDRLITDALRLARLSRSARLTATVIDMIADDEHPPDEQRHLRREPLAELPARAFPRQSAIVTRSMQTILTDLQERPDAAPDEDGREYGSHRDDPTIPEWPKSAAEPRRPPARPTRRVPPWVAATSVIALQHYMQSGAPVLALTDRSRAVVSSLFGDTAGRPSVTSGEPTPEPAAVMADTPRVQVAMVASPVLRPPMIDGEARPIDVQATVGQENLPEQAPEPSAVQAVPITPAAPEEPVTEPTAEIAPEVEPWPLEPAATAQPEPEPTAPPTEAMAPAEPETAPEPPPPPEPTVQVPPEPEPPAPSAEALSPDEPESVPAEPPPPEPTAESLPEQAPADTATETAPPDADEPFLPEAPLPESPAAEMSPPPEPALPESPAAVAVPEPAPQEPAFEQDLPPEPEPAIAEPSPLPELQELIPEQASPVEPEPALEPTVAEPSPPPEPVTEPPAPEPAIVTAPPPPPPSNPAPVAPKAPSMAESVLLERGDRLLAIGDIASARLLYETAAAGGSVRGALLAGRTLDPEYLRSLGTRGVTGDPARAAAWYEKAAELVDDSATALLEALGRR
jgi:hypothetical protein